MGTIYNCIYIAILKFKFHRKPLILFADITVPAIPDRPFKIPPCCRLNKCERITYSRLFSVEKRRRRDLNLQTTDPETVLANHSATAPMM